MSKEIQDSENREKLEGELSNIRQRIQTAITGEKHIIAGYYIHLLELRSYQLGIYDAQENHKTLNSDECTHKT